MNEKLVAYERYMENKSTVSRNELFTAREHKYDGSSVENKYLKMPDTPLAIVSGKLSVEECNDRRLKIEYLDYMTIEPLILDKNSSNYGKTRNYPKLIYKNSIEYKIALIASKEEFPKVKLI